MLITIDMLRDKGACSEGIELFIKLFGESVEYTTELHQRLFQLHPHFEQWMIVQDIIMPLYLQVGDNQLVSVGYRGTANAGDYGTANAGDYGTANAGYYGTANAGYRGTANAGYRGTANAGVYGTANAGDYGTANAGDYGTANAGDYGTANAGHRGTAKAGINGEIRIRYWDCKAQRYRLATGYIGENGLLPNVKYKFNDKHEFVEA